MVKQDLNKRADQEKQTVIVDKFDITANNVTANKAKAIYKSREIFLLNSNVSDSHVIK